MKKTLWLSALVILPFACGGALPVFAADDGFYLGVSGGQSRASFDTAGALAGAPAGTTLTVDTSETAWKVFGGYQVNKYFGGELNYVDLGKYNFSGMTLGIPFSGDAKVNGWGLAAVGTLPLDKGFSLFGKLGAFYSKVDVSATASAFGVTASASASENKWVPQYGIGAKYDFNPNVSVRIEAERFQGMGSNTTTIKTDANLYTIGLSYKF